MRPLQAGIAAHTVRLFTSRSKKDAASPPLPLDVKEDLPHTPVKLLSYFVLPSHEELRSAASRKTTAGLARSRTPAVHASDRT